MQFSITTHAMERWHERCSTHGDEDGRHILAAMAKAVRVEDPKMLPFAMMPDSIYFYLAERNCWFVVESVGYEMGRIVSVIVPSSITKKSIVDGIKVLTEIPKFESRTSECNWIQEQKNLVGKELCKSLAEPLRIELLAYYNRLIEWFETGRIRWPRKPRKRKAEHEQA